MPMNYLITISGNVPEPLWPFLFYGPDRLKLLSGVVPWSDIIFVGIGGLLVTLAMIGVFIFKGYWKNRVTEKVKSIHVYGMNMKDLDSMKGTGLLTDEEFALIKKRQIEKMREEIEREKKLQLEKDAQSRQKKSGASSMELDAKLAAALSREGSPFKGREIVQSVEDQLRAQISEQGGEAPEEAPPSPKAVPLFQSSTKQQDASKKRKDIDADDLLKRGLITFEEYEKIKNAGK